MKTKVRATVVAFLVFSALFCNQVRSEQSRGLRLLTTIFPLTELVKTIVIDEGEVFQLIPTSAEVHTWQLRPGDLKILTAADLLICIGGNFEPWLRKLDHTLDKKKTRIFSFFDYLISINYEGLRPDDPHLWLDFQADLLFVEKISEELIALRPRDAELYRSRTQELVNQLRSLDREYQKFLTDCSQKDLIIAGHEAFGYLAYRYGLRQIALTGFSPEAQPSPRRLQEIVNLIKAKKIKAIFFESSTPPAYARAIARETGAKLYGLSAGVNLTGSDIENKTGFIELMKRNLEILKKGLSCE
jgi:zinc transport system substrate-binding protein